MQAFFDRVSHPALTNITIDWGGMNATEVFPAEIPDLFVGRPVILSGKFTGNGTANVRVKGKVANETEEIPLTLNLDTVAAANPALRPIWARHKIADLADRATWDTTTDLATPIRTLALEHNLMSAFTAFIAVDATKPTEGTHGTTVSIPVPVPEGTRYETTAMPK
jgi:Ca-activated chloride channel family protein